MWKKISTLLKSNKNEVNQEKESQDELRLATAALLYRAGNIDGNVSEIESRKLSNILKTHFSLSDAELNSLVETARETEEKSVDLYGFTKVITEQLDQKGRMAVIELIWQVILADEVIDDFEANLVWRVAELIGVSTRDRVLLKQKVMNARTN